VLSQQNLAKTLALELMGRLYLKTDRKSFNNLRDMNEKLKEIESAAHQELEKVSTANDWSQLKAKFMGKQGPISELMKGLKDVDPAERPQVGARINEVKVRLEGHFAQRFETIKKAELEIKLKSDRLDMTLPGQHRLKGSQHPLRRVYDEIVGIFSKLGFSVRRGPIIEKDNYNFEALNIPKDHPARDMQDTFYIDDSHVLRTQTSPIQIRAMETEGVPLRVLGPGTVFRCDSDISHSPMFHQLEGLWVDKKVSMADLKGLLDYFNRHFFGPNVKTRFRPSFFPFTEPSAEVDCSCPLCEEKGCRMCSGTGWIEMAGCGLVHPNVLSAAKVDPNEYQGLAFGMGIERLTIVKYGVQDIRLFFDNDVRFLEQFP